MWRSGKRVQLTFDDARKPSGHGGWRPGAGRKKGRRTTPHDARPELKARFPVHVTMRIVAGIGTLRRDKLAKLIGRAIAMSHKTSFRVVEFSVQRNHLHAIVEATNSGALSRGLGGMETRIAKRLNRELGRRGDVFADRYHMRILKTPREVRNAIRYVLLNARHHEPDGGQWLGDAWFDPYSSCAWFDGWTRPLRLDRPWKRALVSSPRPTAQATVWLLAVGWKRHGLIRVDEITEYVT